MTRPRSPFPSRHRSGAAPEPSAAPPSWPSARDFRRLLGVLERPAPDCALCGGPPHWRGLWHPTPECSRALGAPAGKTRLVCYSLCRECQALPDAITRVEDLMLEQAMRALAMPESN
jgi:hypothetical protein